MERKCQKCSATVYVSDHFCRNCGSSLKEQQGGLVSVKTGKGSTNIGVGNLPGASIHVGDKYEGGKPEIAPHLRRETLLPVKIGKNHLNTSVLFKLFYGSIILSLIFLLYLIYSFSQGINFILSISSFTSVIVLILPVMMLLGMVGMFLKDYAFMRVGWLNYNFEIDNNGNIYLTKVGGTCPKCNYPLVLSETGSAENKTTVVMCRRNPMQHRWEFDPTVLPELAPENKTSGSQSTAQVT